MRKCRLGNAQYGSSRLGRRRGMPWHFQPRRSCHRGNAGYLCRQQKKTCAAIAVIDPKPPTVVDPKPPTDNTRRSSDICKLVIIANMFVILRTCMLFESHCAAARSRTQGAAVCACCGMRMIVPRHRCAQECTHRRAPTEPGIYNSYGLMAVMIAGICCCQRG